MSQISQTNSQLLLLEGHADFHTQALQLISRARRNIAILSNDLDLSLYGSNEMVETISQFARANRYTQVQILVKNTKPLVESGHKLAKLSQRLSSKIILRKLTVEPDNKEMGFILGDSSTLLYKNDDLFYKGFANFDAAVEVKRLRETFNYIWQYGEPEPEFQLLNI